MAEIQEDISRLRCHGFGTWDASMHFAQRDGNGAIVSLLTCGRPLRDGGQAVKSSKGYGVGRDAREIAEKDPPVFRLAGSRQAAVGPDR